MYIYTNFMCELNYDIFCNSSVASSAGNDAEKYKINYRLGGLKLWNFLSFFHLRESGKSAGGDLKQHVSSVEKCEIDFGPGMAFCFQRICQVSTCWCCAAGDEIFGEIAKGIPARAGIIHLTEGKFREEIWKMAKHDSGL